MLIWALTKSCLGHFFGCTRDSGEVGLLLSGDQIRARAVDPNCNGGKTAALGGDYPLACEFLTENYRNMRHILPGPQMLNLISWRGE
jgi:hypothetical protein